MKIRKKKRIKECAAAFVTALILSTGMIMVSGAGEAETEAERGEVKEETIPAKEEKGAAQTLPEGAPDGNEPTPKNGVSNENEPSSEGKTSSEQETSSEPETSSESGTEKPPWPQGHYLVRILNAAVLVPEGGRVYDGTDRIDITFDTQIIRTLENTGGKDDSDEQTQENPPDEEIPEYHVIYNARLESADAGERKVVCSFSLQTSCPEHVKLDEATTHPDLSVTVKKAVLSVSLSDGTKRYGDPADVEHIHFEQSPVVSVSGFVRDSEGREMIPTGFELPSVQVDPSVLEQWSPIYEQADEALSDVPTVRKYEHALILKTDPQGRVTGNPTENYEFYADPQDERFTGGTITVERAPVKRNTDYELKGEKGAYLMNKDGTVILRSGTSLRVEPKAGPGYNTGAKLSDVKGDTSFTFRLERRNPDGTLAADSLEETVICHCDKDVPEARTQVAGASSSGGMLFSASSASVMISVPDDTVSGISSVRYRTLSGPMNADVLQAALQGASRLNSVSEWKETGQTGSVTLSGEGIFAVEVDVCDMVGNHSLVRSPEVAIDTGVPEIEITGVEDGSANASTVRIQARCHDPSYLPGSLKGEMKADFGGVILSGTLSEDSGGGALLSFGDFPRKKEADAVYHLSVTAKDRAGNTAGKQISFSVNRFGSTYSLADGTADQLKKFYHTKPFDVTYLETNLDKVGNARVLLRMGGNLQELRAGSGLEVSESAADMGMSRYSYTIPASSFKKDGTYEVMLLTTDAAGNSSDSSAQRLPVRFAIDTAAPECLVSGIQPEGRYKEKKMTAVIEVRDNQALEKAEVYVDSRKEKSLKEERSQNAGELIKITLSEKEAWQTIQVHASDKAGNEIWTKEIPVYISSEDPESAEEYHSQRLSAQQIEQIRNSLDTILKRLENSRLFHGKTVVSQTGSVKNLYQAVSNNDRLSSLSRNQEKRTADEALVKKQSKESSIPAAGAGITLLVAAGLAGGGFFWYRRRV